MPAVRQKRSKLTTTCCQASSTIAAGTTPADVIDFPMALLSFADSPPRAYWLKAGNAHLTFSTSPGAFPPPYSVPPSTSPASAAPTSCHSSPAALPHPHPTPRAPTPTRRHQTRHRHLSLLSHPRWPR